jgi:hypothetical protein
MSEMKELYTLHVNVQTLSGPLPEFFKARDLQYCDLTLADYCREWEVPAASFECDFDSIPKCNSDCMVLYEWIEISPGKCCSAKGISCDDEGRIVEM